MTVDVVMVCQLLAWCDSACSVGVSASGLV